MQNSGNKSENRKVTYFITDVPLFTRLSGQDRMKGDHRILGDSAFVMEVLAEAEEKFGLDLRNANLVVLSACETGLSKIYGGDDLVGLSRGFIYAGTPSLLATLWEVDDQSTAILMKKFYENWQKKGMTNPRH